MTSFADRRLVGRFVLEDAPGHLVSVGRRGHIACLRVPENLVHVELLHVGPRRAEREPPRTLEVRRLQINMFAGEVVLSDLVHKPFGGASEPGTR